MQPRMDVLKSTNLHVKPQHMDRIIKISHNLFITVY